jgi:hypothetical protein
MPKTPSPTPNAWALLGIMAACFLGVLCMYHAMYWIWQVIAFHSDEHVAGTKITIWLVLAAGSAFVWCRLVWVSYFPKKKTGEKEGKKVASGK